MSSNKISTKTIARIAAVQAIYQYKSFDGQNIDLIIQRLVQFYKDFYKDEELSINDPETIINKPVKIRLSISYFELLVKTVILNLPQIDEQISKYLVAEWSITSLPILLLALLRVAIGELQFLDNVPDKVVINEFTDIASDMLCETEVGFVNSLLDKIAKHGKD